MKLIDILENEMKMGRGMSYRKYREIISTLLEDLCDSEIIAYQVEEVQSNIVRNIRVLTDNNEQKDFKCISYYDTISRQYLNMRISNDENHVHKGLIITYSPFTITATTTSKKTYKQINLEYDNNDKIKITTHIEDENLDNDDKIEANIRQTINNDNIEKIMNIIENTVLSTKNKQKEKTLIK